MLQVGMTSFLCFYFTNPTHSSTNPNLLTADSNLFSMAFYSILHLQLIQA